MKTLAFLIASLSATALAAPTTWEIDPMHTTSSFSVRHMMVSNVSGAFGKTTGTVTLEGKDWKTAVVKATIDASTIDTRNSKRDEHLKSADFFDVAKFPTITFKSTKVEAAAGGGYRMTGDLTIHGVTKPVVFDVQPFSPEMQSPMGGSVVGTQATAKISRKEFGLAWNKPLDKAGGVMVGDEVKIQLDVELDHKAPPKK